MNTPHKTKRGFTLMEMLLVLAMNLVGDALRDVLTPGERL